MSILTSNKCEFKGCPYPATYKVRDINADCYVCTFHAKLMDEEAGEFDPCLRNSFSEHTERINCIGTVKGRSHYKSIPLTKDSKWDGFHVASISGHGAIGRPYLPEEDMALCVALKVTSGLSARKLIPILRNLAARRVISHVPHYNSILNHERNANTLLLADKVVKSAINNDRNAAQKFRDLRASRNFFEQKKLAAKKAITELREARKALIAVQASVDAPKRTDATIQELECAVMRAEQGARR